MRRRLSRCLLPARSRRSAAEQRALFLGRTGFLPTSLLGVPLVVDLLLPAGVAEHVTWARVAAATSPSVPYFLSSRRDYLENPTILRLIREANSYPRGRQRGRRKGNAGTSTFRLSVGLSNRHFHDPVRDFLIPLACGAVTELRPGSGPTWSRQTQRNAEKLRTSA